MYNAVGAPNPHRGMQPTANNRLNELFDSLRAEFDSQSRSSEQIEGQVANQIQELEMIRNKVYQLEQAQIKLKQEYDNEIRLLRHELEVRGVPAVASHIGGPQHAAPSQPPPQLGHGPSNLFSGIMANQGPGGPGLAPPPEHQPPPQQHPLQPPGPGPQQQGPLQGQQQQPQQQQQQSSFPSYQSGPTLNGYGPQPPQPINSPGLGKSRGVTRPGAGPGPATPQQSQPVPYPDPRASPQIPRPTPPGSGLYAPPRVGNELANLNPEDLPAEQKRVGSDWFAVFNPDLPRVLDVKLLHNLLHESVVCCVRFSQDGKYVATGCNRSAQIYDVNTGQEVCKLQDDTVDKEGDLYIRSVCFSPDGRYLATGAEDKLIRVWDIANKTIRNTFQGHEQDIYSLDFAKNGRHIASGSGDKSVRLWDIETGQQIMQLSIEDGVTTVAISPDGRYVAAGSLDRSVRVWDSTTGYLVQRLEGPDGHRDSVYSVAFSPTGRELVSGSLDKTIKMWELAPQRSIIPSTTPNGGKCIRTFEGHKDYVLSVCLTPGGEWVMSGSKDRGVQFWDPNTGHAQMMLQGHKNSVISVAPSPTGNYFATGSGDNRARIWSYQNIRG